MKKLLTDTSRINIYRRLLKEAADMIEDLTQIDLERGGGHEYYQAQAERFKKRLKELKK